MGQEEALARTHEGEPGLPRGRSGLPTETVRAAQRERLLRAVIAAVASTGFTDLTVADIVRGARVSRAAFYIHFAGKEDCFLAATREGGWLMINQVAEAARRVPAGAGAEEALRAGIAAFLAFLAREPAFARAFYVDMPAAGPPRGPADRGRAAQLRPAEPGLARTRPPRPPGVAGRSLPGLLRAGRRHRPAGPGAGQPSRDRLRAGTGRHAGRPAPGGSGRPAHGRGPRDSGQAARRPAVRELRHHPPQERAAQARREADRRGADRSQYASATAPVQKWPVSSAVPAASVTPVAHTWSGRGAEAVSAIRTG